MNQQQEEPQQLIIKLYLSKEHIRRFTIPSVATFEDLTLKIVQFYDEVGQTINPTEDVDLQYCDDDNEWAVLRNEDDWYCCKAICPSSIKIRKPSMWMKAQFSYKSGQQVVIQTIKKEKKYLIEKSKEIFSQVNDELKKLGSSQEVQKLEVAVSSAVENLIETVTPLLQNAKTTTCEFISSVENSLKQTQSSEPELIRVDDSHDLVEDPVDEEEEQLISQQTVETIQPVVNTIDTMEKSGFVFILSENEKVQAVEPVEPAVEPIVEEAVVAYPEVPIVEPVAEPVVEETVVAEPVVETPFSEQLKMLSLMGFTDIEKNLVLLNKHKGNVSLVVDALLSM